MKKYNNFKHYKSSKNSMALKTPNSSWTSFNENKEDKVRKVSLQ